MSRQGFVIHRRRFRLHTPHRVLELGARTLIMGVVNVTPDSFSDGGQFLNPTAAIEHALAMEASGADIIDIGGESTRPGATAISAQQELDRIQPVLEGLKGKLRVPISLDSYKPDVAEIAVSNGVEILNDITALRHGTALAKVAIRHNLPLILMHMRGEPSSMQKGPFASHVINDVMKGLKAALIRATKAGVAKSKIILDPGIGFGKSYRQSFELLARLPELAKLGCPLLVGTSRKSFIGHALGGVPEDKRLWGTAATVAASILAGVHIVRVQEVSEMVQVAKVTDRIRDAGVITRD
jgi:dihydropteroate synthase